MKYEKFRALASKEAEKRGYLFQEAQHAYSAGNKAKAHELSQEGKLCGERMENYNRQGNLKFSLKAVIVSSNPINFQ